MAGAMEVSYHLTGRYPDWWEGHRFKHPVDAWAASNTTQSTRDALQYTYLGDINILDANGGMATSEGSQPRRPYGCGTIPRDAIIDYSKARNVVDAIDVVKVKHISGGTSSLGFKSYDQGRQKFQGTAKHVIHLDEEPDIGIYNECLMRIAGDGVRGIILLTMTPLLGMTDVCTTFLDSKTGASSYTQAAWSDAPHLTEQEKHELLSEMLPHEIEAREKGIPALGSGKIYPIVEDTIVVAPFEIPDHWLWVFGMDFGWHATAVVFFAYDSDADVLYIVDEYKQGQREPSAHASTIKFKGGKWMPGACDPRGDTANQKDGTNLLEMYRDEGLDLTQADNSVDSGIMQVLERMVSGRFKVFSTCQMWLTEFRRYARDEKGRVIKKNDHLLDATRYGVISGVQLAKRRPLKKKELYDFGNKQTVVPPWAI